ncbi:ATP phosphoribosyltransferase [Legionella sp. W05-934-2]|jgi:ATP phosphoribosyltransferase|uniref:ATP phosphoribosyltransferase n=1 Tax=Legionella sp. W05-934-2 TaxID=1198649 RepID=UPI0034624F3D
MNDRLRIAIQKKGRLFQDSISLLKRCGLAFRVEDNSLLVKVENMPIDLLMVRDDDIPTLVFDRVCDAGIVGENVLVEQFLSKPTKRYQKIMGLNLCQCRLSIAVPYEFEFQNAGSLENKTIATSYPRLLQRYLDENRVNANVLPIAGSVEIIPKLDMADAICDLVSTGRTLADNHLIEVEQIFESEAVFISADKEFTGNQQAIFELLTNRIKGVNMARDSKYIMFHAPKSALQAICQDLPGIETPTIVPLNQEDKVAVHVVSTEGAFWQTLETIKAKGASSILVLPIEKMLG